MKKAILFMAVILTLGLASCSEPTVSKRDLPIEVVNLKDAGKFDTVLYISTESKVYQFSKNQEYVGAYDKTDSVGVGIVIGIILTVLFIALIFAIGNSL